MVLVIVLILGRHCHRYPRLGGLQNGIFFLPALETGSPNQDVIRVGFFWSLSLDMFLPESSPSHLHVPCVLSLSVSQSHKDICYHTLRTRFTLITLWRTYFQMQSNSEFLGSRTWANEFGDPQFSREQYLSISPRRVLSPALPTPCSAEGDFLGSIRVAHSYTCLLDARHCSTCVTCNRSCNTISKVGTLIIPIPQMMALMQRGFHYYVW